jgi:hypothetical protein
MNMKTSKISAIVERFIDGKVCKVLVSESDDFPLGHEPCKLIFSGRVEFTQLNSEDFCANCGSQIICGNAGCEKLWKLEIGVKTVVSMFERLECWVLLVAPSRKVVAILR